MPCTRAIGSSIRRLTISSCSQRTWTSRVNCSDKFLPGRSTVVTARIMRTLSVVLRADVLITHKILCGLHANLLRNKSKSHSTDHPTLNLGCDFIYFNTGKQRGLMKWSSGSLQLRNMPPLHVRLRERRPAQHNLFTELQ